MQLELKRLAGSETGITFIFVTHDQEEALTMSDRIAVMNAGNILQIGSPREIYDHPAERFVANFIGETNFLAAELVSAKKSAARIKLSSGKTIAATMPADHETNGPVTAVVRPEHARIVKPGASAALEGRLDNIVYFGTDTHYHVNLGDDDDFIVRMQNARDDAGKFSTGARVGIDVGADAIQVLRD